MYRFLCLIFFVVFSIHTFANKQSLIVRTCDDKTPTSLESYISHKVFANGYIRLFHVDTQEPVCCSSHLVVYLTSQETPTQSQCFHVASNIEGTGFQSTDLAKVKTSYNAASGLSLQLPLFFYNDTGISSRKNFTLVINQKNQTVLIQNPINSQK